MGFLDLILNITAVFLWINWRMRVVASGSKYRVPEWGVSSRPVYRPRMKSWKPLLFLLLILLGRPFLYWEIGTAANWTPMLKLGAVSIPFRPDQLVAIHLFSWASFIQVLLSVYICLILLGIFGKGIHGSENNFVHRTVQLLVGFLESWPVLFRAALPGVVAAPLWFILCAALEWAHIIPGQESWKNVFHESLVVGLCAYLPWCHLLAGLVLIYFLNSYIYMGPSPLWNYLHNITRKALAPLYLLPLQISKIDFTPVAAMAIIFLIYENGIRLLSALFTLAMR
jgi:uncharacterized protein YggT (Ycf19 family)